MIEPASAKDLFKGWHFDRAERGIAVASSCSTMSIPPSLATHAGEMISELTLAITNKLPMKALADTVHCYPTQAEVFQRIALTYGK